MVAALSSINRLERASLRAVARWPEARGRPYLQGHVIVVYIRSALIFMFLSLYLVLARPKTGENCSAFNCTNWDTPKNRRLGILFHG